MSVANILDLRLLVLTDLHALTAAGVDLTSCRRIGRGRNIALQKDTFLSDIRIRHRNRGKQRFRVRMQRVSENIGRLAGLYHAAKVHNAHGIRNMLYDRQIVRDKQIGQSSLLLQIAKQVNDLCLNRHVQCRYRLIAHDEFRIQRKRTRDTDSLSLTAGKLVRITILVILL